MVFCHTSYSYVHFLVKTKIFLVCLLTLPVPYQKKATKTQSLLLDTILYLHWIAKQKTSFFLVEHFYIRNFAHYYMLILSSLRLCCIHNAMVITLYAHTIFQKLLFFFFIYFLCKIFYYSNHKTFIISQMHIVIGCYYHIESHTVEYYLVVPWNHNNSKLKL